MSDKVEISRELAEWLYWHTKGLKRAEELRVIMNKPKEPVCSQCARKA